MTDATRDNNAAEGVDYKFWSQMSGWTVAEAAALLLDIDPDRAPEKSDEAGTLGWQYWRLHRLLARACKMDELSSPMSPREFLTWASSNGLKPSDQLAVTVRAGKPHRNWKSRYFKIKRERDELQVERDELAQRLSDDVNPRALTSLLRLVGGMARAGFKHTTKNHNIVSLIHDKLPAQCRIHKTSIKKYLDMADQDFEDTVQPK